MEFKRGGWSLRGVEKGEKGKRLEGGKGLKGGEGLKGRKV